MSLPAASVRRPIAILMATLAVCTFGFLAAQRLPVELLPDLSYPTITVQTEYPDAAPLSVEQFVTRPIEEAVGVISGLREMRSVSRPGVSEVVLQFEWGQRMELAAIEVRERLGVVELPREVEPPRVLRFDPSLEPIVRLALGGERPLDELRQLAERWLKPRLEGVDGIAAATVRGGLEPEIAVLADEDRLAALGLTLDDLGRALASENVNQPGGVVRDAHARYLVRTLHEFEDLDQIRRTVVRETGSGRVRVEDVAEVRRWHSDREEVSRLEGREVVELSLYREGSANTVAAAENLREELEELRRVMPADLDLTVLSDQSRYIAAAVDEVANAAWLGGILAVIVLYFFLRDAPSTAIIAVSIPVSVIATFLPMYQADVSLNIMSLGGLALGVGMLVDSSIVVLEAIDRHRGLGRSRSEAAIQGASEVAAAVTASTLTTVSVFLPIVFVKGIAGQLFHDQALTVCFSLLASLVVALTLIPALAAMGSGRVVGKTLPNETLGDANKRPPSLVAPLLGRDRSAAATRRREEAVEAAGLRAGRLREHRRPFTFRLGGWELPPVGGGESLPSRVATVLLFLPRLVLMLAGALLLVLGRVSSRLFFALTSPLRRAIDGLSVRYPGGLERALSRRWLVIGVSVALLALSIAALPLLGTRLVPDLTQGRFAFRLELPEGTPLDTTADVVARIERQFIDDPTFERVFSTVGSLPSTASGRRTLGENLAQIDFVLADEAGKDGQEAAVAGVRRTLARFDRVEAELAASSVLVAEPPIGVRVFSEDLAAIDRSVERLERAVAELPGVTDVASTAEPGSPEVQVDLDRDRAADLGISAADVAAALRRQIAGEVVGQFREGEERIDIRLRAEEPYRDRASAIGELRIRLPGGAVVPVSSLADIDIGRGPAAIHRAEGARVGEVTAEIASGDLGAVLKRVEERVAALAPALSDEVRVEMAGQNEELAVSFSSLRLALILAVFLVYVVMAAQFESLLHPFVILLSVPMGLVGIVAALLVTGLELSVLALIGAVMLAGIVVNNAIVLVDAINRRRRQEGQDLAAALLGAGQERLRPILMTTATTVLGLAPMAIGLGAGDELRTPLAVTVIGGLLVSTFLTLVVIPCVYAVLAREELGVLRAAPFETPSAPSRTPLRAPQEHGPPTTQSSSMNRESRS